MTSVAEHCRQINALATKLERAENKVEQYQVSIGQHIAAIKKAQPDDWQEIIKAQCNLGRSRAYELLAIADGTKTPAQVRADTNQRQLKHKNSVRYNGNTGAARPEPASAERPLLATDESAEQPVLDIEPFDLLVADLKKAGLAERMHDVVRDDLKILYLCIAFVRAGWPRHVLTDFIGQAAKPDEPARATTEGNDADQERSTREETAGAAIEMEGDPGPIPECLRRDRVQP
jgi:hypothetical protein